MTNAVEYRLSFGPRIVTIGGGTGLSALLSGLKGFTRNITAVWQSQTKAGVPAA